jgi:hypothetical protein
MTGSLCVLSESFAPLRLNLKKMIKQLRKRHLQIWALWAVLIPVGIIVARIAVPKKVTQELLQKVAPASTNWLGV